MEKRSEDGHGARVARILRETLGRVQYSLGGEVVREGGSGGGGSVVLVRLRSVLHGWVCGVLMDILALTIALGAVLNSAADSTSTAAVHSRFPRPTSTSTSTSTLALALAVAIGVGVGVGVCVCVGVGVGVGVDLAVA